MALGWIEPNERQVVLEYEPWNEVATFHVAYSVGGKIIGALRTLSGYYETLPVDLWRWVPRLPQYGRLNVLRAVQQGRQPAPSVAPGVNLAAAVVATEVFRILTKQRHPVYAPAVLWCDGYERRIRIFRRRRLSFATSLAWVVLRSQAGRLHPTRQGRIYGSPVPFGESDGDIVEPYGS